MAIPPARIQVGKLLLSVVLQAHPLATIAADFASSPDVVPTEVEIIRQSTGMLPSRLTERLRMTGQDTDRDGVADMVDQCPSIPGQGQTGGCPVRQDTDQDGIADNFDKCDDTPPGVIVEANGCPPPPPDKDGDKIADPEDKCPGTPSGIRVDPTGCPFAPVKLDKDKDGVDDASDKCPDTPYGKKVDAKGCLLTESAAPAGSRKTGDGTYTGNKTGGTGGGKSGGYGPMPNVTQTVNLNFGPTADSDKDGVPDMLDNCPDTKPGQKVNEKGCLTLPTVPLDSDTDKDGVPDSADKCPSTTVNAKVDVNGCNASLEKDVSITLRILFAVDKALIVSDANEDIRQVAEFMQQYPDIRITLEGHTDSDASEKHNLRLSKRRAEAVKAALVARGIAAGRMDTIGYGESRPIADNETLNGKAQNRRVVAVAKGSEVIRSGVTPASADRKK